MSSETAKPVLERYRGKPFLRLLDAYVLWAIGELPGPQRSQLEAVQVKLGQSYGRSGPWYTIVAGVMGFQKELPGEVRNIWSRYQKDTVAAGGTVDPLEFTHLFVDSNWVPPTE